MIAAARYLSRTAVDDEMEAELEYVASLLERHGEAFDLFKRHHRLIEEERPDWVEANVDLLPEEACTALQDESWRRSTRGGSPWRRRRRAISALAIITGWRSTTSSAGLGLEGPSLTNLPTIVVGSFAAVGAVLRGKFDMSADEASDWLNRLNGAARIRRFRSGDPA